MENDTVPSEAGRNGQRLLGWCLAGALYPSAHTGTVPRSWFGSRLLAQAELEGAHVDVQHAASIAVLRPIFYGVATSLGFPDLDGSAIRISDPRDLTQQISRFLWEQTSHDGVLFESRFGRIA